MAGNITGPCVSGAGTAEEVPLSWSQGYQGSLLHILVLV